MAGVLDAFLHTGFTYMILSYLPNVNYHFESHVSNYSIKYRLIFDKSNF